MTKYEEIKSPVSEGWFHGDLKTLSDFANIKSEVSLAVCNTEWMLLYEESCMQQPAVNAFLLSGSIMFSVQTVLWVSLQVWGFSN